MQRTQFLVVKSKKNPRQSRRFFSMGKSFNIFILRIAACRTVLDPCNIYHPTSLSFFERLKVDKRYTNHYRIYFRTFILINQWCHSPVGKNADITEMNSPRKIIFPLADVVVAFIFFFVFIVMFIFCMRPQIQTTNYSTGDM